MRRSTVAGRGSETRADRGCGPRRRDPAKRPVAGLQTRAVLSAAWESFQSANSMPFAFDRAWTNLSTVILSVRLRSDCALAMRSFACHQISPVTRRQGFSPKTRRLNVSSRISPTMSLARFSILQRACVRCMLRGRSVPFFRAAGAIRGRAGSVRTVLSRGKRPADCCLRNER